MKIKYIIKDSKEIRITPDLENLIEKKLTQGLKKYSNKNQEQNVTVRISQKKPHMKLDVETMYLNYHLHATADVAASDGIIGGIEKCVDILDGQIRKYRTRIHKSIHKSKGLNKADFADIDLPADFFHDSYDSDDSDDAGDDGSGRKIIKMENHELKPMNVDEAALQLEVLDYKFLFFHNTDSDSASIVYKRDDGNIGLIEG
jgi:putative sigma-54 modulation protein